MHSYFRNHQLYLAERSEWLDRHVAKTSKRAISKIAGWKEMAKEPEKALQLKLVEKLVVESLLIAIANKVLLTKEGFFLSNMDN